MVWKLKLPSKYKLTKQLSRKLLVCICCSLTTLNWVGLLIMSVKYHTMSWIRLEIRDHGWLELKSALKVRNFKNIAYPRKLQWRSGTEAMRSGELRSN